MYGIRLPPNSMEGAHQKGAGSDADTPRRGMITVPPDVDHTSPTKVQRALLVKDRDICGRSLRSDLLSELLETLHYLHEVDEVVSPSSLPASLHRTRALVSLFHFTLQLTYRQSSLALHTADECSIM